MDKLSWASVWQALRPDTAIQGISVAGAEAGHGRVLP